MNAETRKALYRKMLRIRLVEEAIADNYAKQEMRCPVHLSIGQEAVPVALCEQLGNEDRIYSTHRCHAHYLAKDGSLDQMIAELHGKVTGCCKGKGGSMHLVHRATGMMGSSALVGGTIPLAVGNALAQKMMGKNYISVAFFGDGASEEGLFFESLNIASLKKLPVLFVCENNLYATYSHQRARQARTEIHRKGEPFGVEGIHVDGNDAEAMYRVSTHAISRARRGLGPTLIECATYRWRDHVGPSEDIKVGYRTESEVELWKTRCPIERLEKKLLLIGELLPEDKKTIREEILLEIENAFIRAKADPYPPVTEIFNDIYAQPQI